MSATAAIAGQKHSRQVGAKSLRNLFTITSLAYDWRMSIWIRISELISQTAGDALSGAVEAVRSVFAGDPETRRQVSFSIALIALSAKMAKADGVVTPDEVQAFQQIFHIPQSEAARVSRLYNLAKQDVAGFDAYGRQVAKLFPAGDPILEDVMDGLFHIAKADGVIHEREREFLDTMARVFAIDETEYRRIRLRHMDADAGDPYALLGADPHWDNTQLKAHWRQLVRDNHPDRMMARGVPAEFIAIANARLAAINSAWETIARERGL